MLLTAVTLAIVVSASVLEADVEVDGLRAAAKNAASAERWCDAHAHFQTLFARTSEIKYLYNAAEVARAAHDNVNALAAYRNVARLAPPDFLESARVKRAIAELEAALVKGDLGVACASEATVPVEPQPPATPTEATSIEATPPATTVPPANTLPGDKPRGSTSGSSGSASSSSASTSNGSSALVVAGGVLAGAGTLASAGFGAWALALESQLRTRAPDVTREQKDAALAAGVPVVLGASAGVVVAGAGAALIVAGLE